MIKDLSIQKFILTVNYKQHLSRVALLFLCALSLGLWISCYMWMALVFPCDFKEQNSPSVIVPEKVDNIYMAVKHNQVRSTPDVLMFKIKLIP